ncbi:MltA domain-containing protein [uncultured Thiothrix sp.]|uniref:murein transglycosylase A n=1 Tax=uncultured Thiothrix sp. TaxID=223185 RepID=UPI00261F3776|nr:MltA domain-containing protein [uncultured Thiothrix sp.]
MLNACSRWKLVLTLTTALFLSACDDQKPSQPPAKPTGPITSEALSWDKLPGWSQDQAQEAWPALLSNCLAMAKKEAFWETVCQAAQMNPANDAASARLFFEQYFTPYQLFGENLKAEGLLTGYYEPLLQGSFTPSERFQYPIYSPPKDMLTIELAELYPELKDKRVRGRLVEGNRVVPYYDRATIDGVNKPLAGQEIVWVDNKEDLFFLHIQGSGRVQLPDGKVIGVAYANQNGLPYVAIGKRLQEWGKLKPGTINMFSIKQWIRDNPTEADKLLNENPSYVFFSLRENIEQGPVGSLGVPLTAGRSLAVDRKVIDLGSLMWIDTTYPDTNQPLQRLMFAQDTGGAIKGDLRGDFFFGTGQQAETWAGHMKQKTRFYILKPKTTTPAH